MNDELQCALQILNKSLQIRNVQFQDIHSKRNSIGFQPEVFGNDAVISWNQQFADDDPVINEDGSLIFRPKYFFSIKNGEKVVFEVTMIAALLFSIEDKDAFEKNWAKEEIKKLFLEKQIMRLMWTILRQQLMDCMSRHSLQPIPLPWIV
jgi:hypothetical protein